MTNEQYYDMKLPYQDALNLLLARLEVLNHTMYDDGTERPIHNIQSRIKSKKSIEEKLERMVEFGKEAYDRSDDKVSRNLMIFTKEGKELLAYDKVQH